MPFLDSNLSQRICYKVFYSQVLRYQRLCSYIGDFQERTKILGDALLGRGYRLEGLLKEFARVVYNYKSEFERWDIPLDIGFWFRTIIHNPLTNNFTNSSLELNRITYFSQPLPDPIRGRNNYFSQT